MREISAYVWQTNPLLVSVRGPQMHHRSQCPAQRAPSRVWMRVRVRVCVCARARARVRVRVSRPMLGGGSW
jgi:hypothetical protein